MRQTFSEFPGWFFEVEEVSAGIYNIVGVHKSGKRISAEGVIEMDIFNVCKDMVRKAK